MYTHESQDFLFSIAEVLCIIAVTSSAAVLGGFSASVSVSDGFFAREKSNGVVQHEQAAVNMFCLARMNSAGRCWNPSTSAGLGLGLLANQGS